MTRKDFVRVASTLNKLVVSGADKSTLTLVITELCEVFQEINPRFDIDKFTKAVWQDFEVDSPEDKDTLCKHHECNALRKHAMKYIPDFNRTDIECFANPL